MYTIYLSGEIMTNPLMKYHVQPGIFVKLPSEGRFYGTQPQMTADGEVEIHAMNAIDELQMQNPDGLLNNEALFKVIERCVPSIPKPREIPKPDLDVILLGLKIATYGETTELEPVCEKCGYEGAYDIDLLRILTGAKSIEGDTSVDIGELKVNIKPYTVDSEQKLLEIMVSIQRLANDLDRRSTGNESDLELIATLEKEMSERVQESAIEVFNVASAAVADVVTPDTVITEREYIDEWLAAIKGPEYKIIRDAIQNLSESVVDTNVSFECRECGHKNTLDVELDPASFFVSN